MSEESRDDLKNENEPDEILTRESPVNNEELSISEMIQSSHVSETGDSPEDPEKAPKVSETAKVENSPQNVSPSSAVSTSPIEGTETRRKHSSSSDSAVMELNRAARSLDHCVLDSGKLVVFQRYFHQPKMKFFVKPDGRRRHNAGNQSQHVEPHDPAEVQHPPEGEKEDPLGYVRSYNPPPGPTLNQAGAVIGYPERKPTVQKSGDNENEIISERPFDPEHSLGSAETVPIDEVYAGNFSPVNRRDGSDAMSSAGIPIKVSSDECSVPSDSLPDAVRVSPMLSNSDAQLIEKQARQRRFGLSQPVDIPGRTSGSRPSSSGSYPDNFHRSVSQQSSLEFGPSVSTYINPTVLAKRKISKDSSADNSHRSLSRESSVDLDMYMTAKPLTTSDDEVASKLSPSAESPLLIPDLVVDPSGTAQDLSLAFSEMTLTAPLSVDESSASISTDRAENRDLRSSENSTNQNAEDSKPIA